MKYLLVENRQTVYLHTDWKQRFIQSELDFLEIDYQIPPVEVGYIKLNDNFEIIPISSENKPSYSPLYEELTGPSFTYNEDNTASEFWTKKDRDIVFIKSDLKSTVTAKRYEKEVSGVKANVQNIQVTVDTSREGRNVFVQKYALMNESETVLWKFPEDWVTLTKEEMSQIVSAGANHIQEQFAWEQSMCNQIDSANTIEELKTIEETINLPKPKKEAKRPDPSKRRRPE